jgi:hypothetical protein
MTGTPWSTAIRCRAPAPSCAPAATTDPPPSTLGSWPVIAFLWSQFAALLAELDRYPEGEGTTVLDNSLLILATDFGDGGGHFHGKMGYVLAGNLGAARRGYHLRATPANGNFYTTSNFNVNQLLHSILDMAGVTENGQAVEFGLRGFLSKVGRPRRIDELFA